MLPEKVSSYDHKNEDTVTKTKIYDMRTHRIHMTDLHIFCSLPIFIYLVTFIGYNFTYLWTIYNISQLRNEINVLLISQVQRSKVRLQHSKVEPSQNCPTNQFHL